MLAQLRVKTTYIMECVEHTWFAGSVGNKELAEELIRDHNNKFHEEVETNG